MDSVNLAGYSPATKAYLDSVCKYLVSKYGAVQNEWIASIILLGDTLDLYNMCMESIRENGIFDVATYKKNPLLTTVKDQIATINKITQKLGITPYDAAKIKMSDEDDSGDFIEALTND